MDDHGPPRSKLREKRRIGELVDREPPVHAGARQNFSASEQPQAGRLEGDRDGVILTNSLQNAVHDGPVVEAACVWGQKPYNDPGRLRRGREHLGGEIEERRLRDAALSRNGRRSQKLSIPSAFLHEH